MKRSSETRMALFCWGSDAAFPAHSVGLFNAKGLFLMLLSYGVVKSKKLAIHCTPTASQRRRGLLFGAHAETG